MKHFLHLLLLISVVLLLWLGGPGAASANTLLIESPTTADHIYQQTQDHPCIFGSPDCHNVAGFGYTDISFGGSVHEIGIPTAMMSPTYLGSDIHAAIGTYDFFVGVEVNQAGQKNPQDDPYLTYFAEYINGTLVAVFGTEGANSGGTPLNITHNGNGWTDDLITGFVAPGPTDQVYFKLSYYAATDGSEAFFLTPNTPVPEPASLLLFGSGLSAIGIFVRRKMM